MFTNERLGALARRYKLMRTVPLVRAYVAGLHEALNLFDSVAGIDTSGGIKAAPIGRNGVVAVNYIGARLALHEQHVTNNTWDEMDRAPEKHFHWLGHDACCQCGCGEHRRI